MECKKAVEKIKKIINEQPEFGELFENPPQILEMVKIEPASQSPLFTKEEANNE